MAKTIHQKTSEKIGKLFDLYPLNLTDAPSKADEEMRAGLAHAFSDRGFRKYMESAILKTNKNLISAFSQDQMVYYKSRVETLLQIMAAGKFYFSNSEMMKNHTDKARVKQVEAQLEEVTNI